MTNSLLAYSLESGACLLAFFLFFHLVLRQETCFGFNRAYLLAATVLSLLLPLLQIPVQVAAIAPLSALVAAPTAVLIKVPVADAAASQHDWFHWSGLLGLLYVGGFSYTAYRFLRQLLLFRALKVQHQATAETRDGITYIPTQGAWPTFSFFRCIFWDNTLSLSAADQERILQHERVHVRQGHSYDLLFMEVLCILFWFNPLLPVYRKALVAVHEFMADAQVVTTGDRKTYGLLLANQVLQASSITIGHFFNKSLTLKRIHMIHQTNRRTPKMKQLLALPLVALLVLSLSSYQLHLQASAEPQAATREHTPKDQNSREPQFPGGKNELYKFLANNIRIPSVAQKNNEYGSVFIQLTIDKNGNPGNMKVLQASHPSLEKKIVRVVNKMSAWETNGTTSPTTFVFPFSILIDGFKNDKTKMTQDHQQSLAKVSSQLKGKPVHLMESVVVVGYGPMH
ncbi:M56 family metallopeptidase [Rufibacter quisquiliarum]|uniref:TonB C-terminal domain-containing protein n=1 Tax=Rufibacter quisquiliarum TaxID=1549639 RepID=A0A839GH57_9BACT|nr:M56 family metallopeptidase [Rufibacter quisquiliarum]MBA9078994.1 hypothetical protein [Rufibacter quisquiliarum]